MRSLMGKLNKFALAPGSLSDIGTASDIQTRQAPVAAKPAVKKIEAPAPPKKEPEDEATTGSEDA